MLQFCLSQSGHEQEYPCLVKQMVLFFLVLAMDAANQA